MAVERRETARGLRYNGRNDEHAVLAACGDAFERSHPRMS
jgi:hypothetical protein